MRAYGTRYFAALAALGLAVGAGVAIAQKPPTASPPQAQSPRAPAQGAKPPAIGQAPAPSPPVAAAPSAPPGGKPGAAPTAPPPVIAAPTQPAPLPQPVPANEPPGITALRQLLPPGAQLSYVTADTLDAATGRARMTGVVLVEGTARITADEITVERASREGVRALQLRNLRMTDSRPEIFTVAEAELQDLVLRMPAPGASPTAGSFDAARIALRDARLEGEVSATIASLILEGWGAGRPTSIAMTGVEIGGPQRNAPFDRLRIGRLTMAGTDIPGAVMAVLTGRPAATIAGEPFFDLEDLGASLRGEAVAAIAAIAMRSRMDASGSGTGSVAIRGVRVLPAAGIAEWLARFGYADIQAELTAESSYDARTGRVELTALRLAGVDIGTFGLRFMLDGLTQDAIMRSDYSNTRFIGGGLSWLDQSILLRFLRDQARASNTTEAALREQHAAFVGGMLTDRRASGPNPLRDAIMRYIRGQASEVSITAAPPQPLNQGALAAGAMSGPAEIQRLLGITATSR